MSLARVSFNDVWIAGDPANPLMSGAQMLTLPLTRSPYMQTGSNFPATFSRDNANAATGATFFVTREFDTVAHYAAFVHSIMSIAPPYAVGNGVAVIRREFGDAAGELHTDITANGGAILRVSAIKPTGPKSLTIGFTIKAPIWQVDAYVRTPLLIDSTGAVLVDEHNDPLAAEAQQF